MAQQDRYWQAKKVTLIGGLMNALLGIIKIIGGIVSHSHALVADGIHSFSDLISDAMVLFASKYGSLDADDTHPYGHQRIETAATLFLSLLLCMAGLGIAWDAFSELIQGTHTIPKWLSLPVICSSIIINEALFHYTRHVGLLINSSLIIANAWHHRSDAASSVVVLIGILGSLAGFTYLDALAAVIVGLMVIKMGWDYGWNSVKELVDTAASPELLKEIEQVIAQVDGIEKIHQLRSRFMGNDVLIDVHIMVSPKISVSEGHYIAQHVHHALVNQIASVKDVIVHVDHEDDETCSPSLHLPSRVTIQKQLFNPIQDEFPQILFWNIHYLDGAIHIDVTCNSDFKDSDKLSVRIKNDKAFQSVIKEVRVYTSCK